MPIVFRHFLRVSLAALTVCLAPAGCGGGGGGGGGAAAPTPSASGTVGAAGGTVTVTDINSPIVGTQVTIPAGALSAPTNITITPNAGGTGLPTDAMVVDLGPSGTLFSQPVTVTIKYSAQYLTDNSITDPTTLKVVSIDAGAANSTLGTVSQDNVNRTVTAQTTHFSSFAVLGYTNATLSGSYTMVLYHYNPATPQGALPSEPGAPPQPHFPAPGGFRDQISTITFDGAGNFNLLSGTTNSDGTSSAVPSAQGTYSIAPDGTFNIASIGISGGVLAGGSAFVFAATSGDTQIGIGIKNGGSFSNASLNGSYSIASYSYNAAATQPTLTNPPQANMPAPAGFNSELATLTLNGAAGTFTLSGTVNSDGTATPDSGSGTYSVNADGSFTTNVGLTGNVLAGGSMFVFRTATGETRMGVGVKQGGSFSTASASGLYTMVQYSFNAGANQPALPAEPAGPPQPAMPSPLGFRAQLATLTLNGGAGTFTLSGTQNADGTGSSISGSGTYAVAADGTFTTSTGLTGTLLADGSTLVFATTSGNTQMGVGIRR